LKPICLDTTIYQQQINIILYCILTVFQLILTTILILKIVTFDLETHMVFLDLEKAFDRVNQRHLWQILNRRGIPYHLTEVIKSLYKGTSVQIDTGRKI
jgi:hypothetical protein